MPPGSLGQVLQQLGDISHPDLLAGTAGLEDAGVFRLDNERALVQTVDFFPPIVDDPRWFGRIAAANALSDVYAMGGRALTALNIVGWPKELGVEVLGEVLAGGLDKFDEGLRREQGREKSLDDLWNKVGEDEDEDEDDS